MGKIISDISKRVLIVEGADEVERIKHLDQGKSTVYVESLGNDTYRIEFIYKVGDYYRDEMVGSTRMIDKLNLPDGTKVTPAGSFKPPAPPNQSAGRVKSIDELEIRVNIDIEEFVGKVADKIIEKLRMGRVIHDSLAQIARNE